MSGYFQAAMRRLLWFVVGLLISAVWLIPTARAETCTATVCTQAAIVGTTSPAVQRWTSGNGAGGNWAYATQADYNRLCGSITPSGTKIAEPTTLSNGASIATGQYCVIGGSHYNAGVSFAAICNESWGGPGGTLSGSAGAYVCTTGTGLTCPATGGWTLSGSNCTRPACASGTTRQSDGSCLANCNVAENDQVDPGGYYEDTGHGAEVSDCVQGCRVYIGGKIFKEAGKTYGQAWSYGTPCTGSTVPGVETTAQNESCAQRGLCGGTANGKEVCTACDETSQTTKTTKTETPASGTPVTTTTTTTEVCKEAGSCTTTTTVSSSAGGSSTTTTKAPGGTAPGEGTTPSGTGSCSTDSSAIECANSSYEAAVCSAAPICTGDAVQCAQALEVWKTRCDILKAITPDVADDAPISEADAKEATREAYQDQMDTIKDQITGALPDPSAESKSAWESALSSGWFDAITITGCTAVDYSVGPYVWHFDPCPIAEKISTIGSYALWLTLIIGGFVFVTGGRNAGLNH